MHLEVFEGVPVLRKGPVVFADQLSIGVGCAVAERLEREGSRVAVEGMEESRGLSGVCLCAHAAARSDARVLRGSQLPQWPHSAPSSLGRFAIHLVRQSGACGKGEPGIILFEPLPVVLCPCPAPISGGFSRAVSVSLVSATLRRIQSSSAYLGMTRLRPTRNASSSPAWIALNWVL